jgi:hypothetical protein
MESIVVNDTMLLVLALYGVVVYEGRIESEEIVCNSVRDADERMCRAGGFVELCRSLVSIVLMAEKSDTCNNNEMCAGSKGCHIYKRKMLDDLVSAQGINRHR